MSEVNERTQRTSLLRGPVTDIPGLTTYLATNFLPIAGGTMAGDLDMDGSGLVRAGTVTIYDEDLDDYLPLRFSNGIFQANFENIATYAYSSNASNLTSGQVSDNRLSANVARRDQANNIPSGSTASPSLRFGSDTNSGFFAAAANQFGVAVGGVDLFRWATGVVYCFAGTFQAYGDIRIGSSGDVRLLRNATGPAFETRAAGGLKVCNADGSAVAAVQCSDITVASGSQIRSSGAQASRLYFTDGFGLGSGFNFAGYNTPNPAFSMYMDASGAWVLRQRSASWIAWTDNGATAGAGSAITSMISQASAGVLQIGTTSNNALGSLNLANLTASGSVLAAGGNAGCGGGGMALSWTGVSSGMIAGGQFIVYENGTNRMALIDSVGMHIASGHGIRFGSAASGSGSADVGLKRKASSPGIIEINNGTWGNSSGSIELTNLTLLGSYRPGQFTVATLPNAAANTGRTVQVTDSSVDFPGNIGNTVAGGGANNVDVKSNGTNWRITG